MKAVVPVLVLLGIAGLGLYMTYQSGAIEKGLIVCPQKKVRSRDPTRTKRRT